MHKKNPKICPGCRVSSAKIYLYHSTAKARPHREEWQTDTSVQKQCSMPRPCVYLFLAKNLKLLTETSKTCFQEFEITY